MRSVILEDRDNQGGTRARGDTSIFSLGWAAVNDDFLSGSDRYNGLRNAFLQDNAYVAAEDGDEL
ncbi:hypothetical protein BBP40_001172 [Aspergillus hancockii]|nr:hypothetical protein BBP40_001172 [Aspergillus hancockii]